MKPFFFALPAAAFFLFLALVPSPAEGKIIAEKYEYKCGGNIMEGYIAYESGLKTRLPAVIIVHEWNGLGEYVKKRAEQIAALGYFAFAADIYGKGVRPATMEESAQKASEFRKNRDLMLERINAALEEVRKGKIADPKKIAVMGYCFGGGVALELVRSGAELSGAVSFHGNLDTLKPAGPGSIKTKLLAFQGADDPFVTPNIVAVFQDEMKRAGPDWQLVIYGGAVHGFTNPKNGNNPKSGLAYNEKADHRSWEALKLFLREAFK